MFSDMSMLELYIVAYQCPEYSVYFHTPNIVKSSFNSVACEHEATYQWRQSEITKYVPGTFLV